MCTHRRHPCRLPPVHRSLSAAGLTGTLPPQLFRTHPRLSTLVLTGNQLSGPLPEAWANDTAVSQCPSHHSDFGMCAFMGCLHAAGSLLAAQSHPCCI